MSNSTKKPFAELLQSTLSPEERKEHKENYSNEELSTFEQIPHTPFWLIGDKEKGYAAIMGKFKITETLPTAEQIKEIVYTQPYELLITIMSAVFEVLLESKSKPIDEATKQPTLFGYNEDAMKENYNIREKE